MAMFTNFEIILHLQMHLNLSLVPSWTSPLCSIICGCAVSSVAAQMFDPAAKETEMCVTVLAINGEGMNFKITIQAEDRACQV